MARKFGTTNQIKIDPLSYNTVLLGEPKIGKTTLIKEVCEILVGNDGYMFFEMDKEDGADAIQGIFSETIDSWDKLTEVKDEIIDNRTSDDWKSLKVIVIDTYDGFIDLAEKESIRLSNKEYPDAKVKSIDAAWKGFQRGQKKALELMLDTLWDFKRVGISFIVIGHVKNKETTDVVSGETYNTLTNDVEKIYFNGLKKKVHFLGLAYFDRTIKSEKTGKKDFKNKEISVGKIKDQKRMIKFRDDSHVIDAGSRFAEIVSEVEFSADNFILALTDAIKAEQSKSGKTFEETKLTQEKQEVEKMKLIAAKEKENKNNALIKEVVSQIAVFMKSNIQDNDIINSIMDKTKELGFENPMQIDNLKDANELKKLIK